MAYAPIGSHISVRLVRASVVHGECWRWVGAHSPKGYGQITIDGKRHAVHRVAYQTWNGPLPSGLEINHICFVRDCINPKHLEIVTHAQNIQRRCGKPYALERVKGAPSTHCHHGHPYTPENTIWYRGKYRTCRECHYANIRRRRAARKAA